MIMELDARGAGDVPAAAGQTAGNPGLDSAVDGSWIQECMDSNQSQENNGQGPPRMQTMKEESKSLVIPQF